MLIITEIWQELTPGSYSIQRERLLSGPTTVESQSNALNRCLGVAGALFLTLSAVTPASSVFVIVSGVIAQAGTGALLSMAAAALLSVPIAYVYAELSSAFPIAGGEYCMVGYTLGRSAGFAVLGLAAFGGMLAPAALALGAGTYISVVIPGLSPTIVAIAIIAVTSILGILHIRTNAWITGIFLFLELLALALLAGLGLWNVKRSLLELITHPVWVSGGALQKTPLAVIVLATSISVFAYDGYGSAIYFSEEMRCAPRAIARTILWALTITVITEMLPVTAVLVGVPDLKSFLSSPNPFGEFVMAIGGRFLNIAISIGIALAILNAVLATTLQNARFFYSTGRDGTWHRHINKAFTTIHPRLRSPWIATLVPGLASIIMCFLGINLILVLTGTSIAVVYAAVCIAAISGRHSGTSSHATYRMPLYPFPPVIGLAALGYVFYVSALDPVFGRPSLLVDGAIVALSLGYYRLVLRNGDSWVLREHQ